MGEDDLEPSSFAVWAVGGRDRRTFSSMRSLNFSSAVSSGGTADSSLTSCEAKNCCQFKAWRMTVNKQNKKYNMKN